MTFSTFDPEEEEDTTNEWARLIGEQPDHKSCFCCASKDVRSFHRECNKLIKGTLSIYDIDYHVDDFVYVYTRSPNLAVAQIRDLLQNDMDDKLRVRMLVKVQPEQAYYDRTTFVSSKR